VQNEVAGGKNFCGINVSCLFNPFFSISSVSEEQHLKQIYLDEQFGAIDDKRKVEEEKKKV
jgi:hypothetical protein